MDDLGNFPIVMTTIVGTMSVIITVFMAIAVWQLSGFGGTQKTIGKLDARSEAQEEKLSEIKKEVTETRVVLEKRIDDAKGESELAHANIGTRIANSEKKNKKRNKKMKSRISAMDKKLDELIRTNNSESNSSSNSPS